MPKGVSEGSAVGPSQGHRYIQDRRRAPRHRRVLRSPPAGCRPRGSETQRPGFRTGARTGGGWATRRTKRRNRPYGTCSKTGGMPPRTDSDDEGIETYSGFQSIYPPCRQRLPHQACSNQDEIWGRASSLGQQHEEGRVAGAASGRWARQQHFLKTGCSPLVD